VGGIGSGKTLAGALKAVKALQEGCGDGVVIAPTYPMLRDSTQHTMFEIIEMAGLSCEFNKAEQVAEINGQRVLFRSGDKPERLRGPNLAWAWLDEAALMRPTVFDIVLGRLRVGKPAAWITTTPNGVNWVYDRWMADDPEYELIRARTQDNINLPDEYIADLEAAYSGEFAAQELGGQFVQLEGLIYDEFDPNLHVVDVEPGEDWERYSAIDFGYTNPFVCLWGALDGDGRLYIYDEHYKTRELISYHAVEIKQRGPVRMSVADHDAQDVAELRQAGVNTKPAEKDVLPGIRTVKARLQKHGDGRPRLYIHPRCVNLLREIGMYVWDESPSGATKERPRKENDHAMDALRYLCMAVDNARTPKVWWL
jgi:phage terminase large subunit